jgi:cytochrome bd-type quinol oxidase subunit 2
MKILPIILFLLVVGVTFALAEKKAPLPPAARPARRIMFLSALVGALGFGWLAYTLVNGGPAWWLFTAPLCILAAITGILLGARAMRRALFLESNPTSSPGKPDR